MKSAKRYLVTGGTGFIGASLVKRLIEDGHFVRVLDNNYRGNKLRLSDISGDFEFIEGDIRNRGTVIEAAKSMDSICHLAFINGTEYFYEKPELVLEVGVKGITNVIDACLESSVSELVLASSSEVYQTPPTIPTPETVPLSIPDPNNPRYSYAAGKIISEIMSLNYGRKHIERVIVFRPHNVYGPNMGFKHVLPQFIERVKDLVEAAGTSTQNLDFSIEGSGKETRAFVYIDDFIDGVMLLLEKGEHMGTYHIGNPEQITIEQLARITGNYFNVELNILPGELRPGGTPRRCPDISKISKLGYKPKWQLKDGIATTAAWYVKELENPTTARV